MKKISLVLVAALALASTAAADVWFERGDAVESSIVISSSPNLTALLNLELMEDGDYQVFAEITCSGNKFVVRYFTDAPFDGFVFMGRLEQDIRSKLCKLISRKESSDAYWEAFREFAGTLNAEFSVESDKNRPVYIADVLAGTQTIASVEKAVVGMEVDLALTHVKVSYGYEYVSVKVIVRDAPPLVQGVWFVDSDKATALLSQLTSNLPGVCQRYRSAISLAGSAYVWSRSLGEETAGADYGQYGYRYDSVMRPVKFASEGAFRKSAFAEPYLSAAE